MNRSLIAIACVSVVTLILCAVAPAAPNFADTIARPLRYDPRGTDFVAIDGSETFNRPLYGSGTPFRVDAGDKPEFSLFLPGRGGVLRLGVRRGELTKWLINADTIEARYRPGSMLYTIRDPVLGDAELHVSVMASFVDEALLATVELRGETEGVELIAAFGGANGERGSRNGDIGTEKLPVREFFQLKPEHCKDNRFAIDATGFTLTAKPAILVGRSHPAMTWTVADAAKWNTPIELLESNATDTPVVVGRAILKPNSPTFIRIDRRPLPSTQPGTPQPSPIVESDFDADFAESELMREQIATRVTIDTPDAYLNAAMTALNIATEGTWDSKEKAVMHGAVAWRVKLLGWRGPYALDALGTHDRLRQHMANWFDKQNVNPIPAQIPVPEASANLARNEDALHSNGNLTDNHYDMNLVAIDALFRHLLWTGDEDYAKQVWPVIERHLAWECRMFRREFGPNKLPLYEGYACIWASDDLWYNGGGATHASAFNAFHNRMAAKIARWIGEDGSQYDKEADDIVRAMRELLWINDGHYAEWKDLLGEQLVHPSAAAWSVYHVIDSRMATPDEAWTLARYAATRLPRIPIVGPNVPPGTFQIATSDWTPYQWSTNNVVMAESAHTSLAMFQANRNADAFGLLKGAILDSMYLGQCPGNVGMATPLDMARNESQRDFADGCGALSRAIVEGLFGVTPDAMEGTLTLTPRFPAEWNHASIRHPDLDFAFNRTGTQDTFVITSRLPSTKQIELILSPTHDGEPSVTLDGKRIESEPVADAVGKPLVRVRFASSDTPQTLQITWTGKPIQLGTREFVAARGVPLRLKLDVDAIDSFVDPQSVSTDAVTSRNGFLTLTPTGPLGHRTLFAKVKQGRQHWLWPIELDVREPIEITASSTQQPDSIAFMVRNNQQSGIRQDVEILVDGKGMSTRLELKSKQSTSMALPVAVPGTHRVQIRANDKTLAEGQITNWLTPMSTSVVLETVDLRTSLNDRVTQIFRNEYLSPRSPFVSLSVPKQGIGSWCKPAKQFDVDDAGLRDLASKTNGIITLPNGIRFLTPFEPDAKNVAFVSQWSNYPKSIDIPLNGKAHRAYLLVAGSTQSMQSQFDNGEVLVTYTDGSTSRLALRNPTTWWPIDQDYPIDDFAFRYEGAIPPRIDLKTGTIRLMTRDQAKGKGRTIEGGAATVLDLPLDPSKELKSLTVRAIANEVVIGLISVTLERPR